MRRPITTAILMLLFVVGAFLLVEQDRFGWAQAMSSTGEVPEDIPAASTVAPFKKSSRGASSGYGNYYGSEMASGYGDEMGSGYGEEAMGGARMMGGSMMGSPPPVPFRVQLNRKAAKLRHAKTGDERSQIQSDLEKLLGGYFDKDMEIRQASLDDVKERVAKLESLLSKRQAAKKEIIDLQLKIMVNESEGLGFFSAPDAAQSGGFGGTLFDTGGGKYGMDGGYGEVMEEYGDGDYGMGMDMYGGEEESTGRSRRSR